MINKPINTAIAFALAFLLKGITYSIGKFDFTSSTLFSFKSFFDFIILFLYYLLFLFIINKVTNKNGVTYNGKLIKDMQKNGLKIYLDGEYEEITIKSDSEMFVLVRFINEDNGMRGLSIKRI